MSSSASRFKDVLGCIVEIREHFDSGTEAPGEIWERLRTLVDYPDLRELFASDWEDEWIAQRAVRYRRITVAEDGIDALVDCVRTIRDYCSTNDLERTIAGDTLVDSVPHPNVYTLIRDSTLSDREVVEAALTYSPIRL